MRLGAALLLVLAVSACSSEADSAASSSAPAPSATSAAASPSFAAQTVTDDYLPGLPATMYLPADTGPADLVVLVPGGGWSSADPTGLIPLAQRLADNGDTAVTMTYSTTSDGTTFPTPVDDVVCAVRWSAQQAADNGRPPERVIVFGHSAGGHLAALAATSGDAFGGDCPYAATSINGLIGVAGVYDIGWTGDYLNDFFGGSREQMPDSWNQGDPMWWVTSGNADLEGLRVLLVHGDADTTVPLELTTKYADALDRAGNHPDVVILPGQTHDTIYHADVIGDTITNWLAG